MTWNEVEICVKCKEEHKRNLIPYFMREKTYWMCRPCREEWQKILERWERKNPHDLGSKLYYEDKTRTMEEWIDDMNVKVLLT